jgi:hypothetical protein
VRGHRPFDELAAVASTTLYQQPRTAAKVGRENPLLYRSPTRACRRAPNRHYL